jgi:hypothetical protein
VTDVGAEFNQQLHLGALYSDPTGLRAASPSFITVSGTTYMFYEQGDRLDAKIAYAVESATPTPRVRSTPRSTPRPRPTSRPRPSLQNVILDNGGGGVAATGGWTASTGASGYYGANFLHDGNTGKGTKTVRYAPTLAGGTYNVYARWAAHENRASNTPFAIVHAAGATTVNRDQRTSGGQWVLLGTFTFSAGTPPPVAAAHGSTCVSSRT